MSAKKSTKTTSIPDTITLTAEEKKLPELKQLLKRREELKRKADICAKMPEVLAHAGKVFGKTFKTIKGLANYEAKMMGRRGKKAKRAPRLTDAQKAQIRGLKDQKTHAEIAKELNVSVGQVAKVLSS